MRVGIRHELAVLFGEVQDRVALGALDVADEAVLVLEAVGLTRRDLGVSRRGSHTHEAAPTTAAEGSIKLDVELGVGLDSGRVGDSRGGGHGGEVGARRGGGRAGHR